MLRSLVSREIGLTSQNGFSDRIKRSRIKSLDLSTRFDFEPADSYGITTCDLELDEERYLLAGSGKGHILIYDLRFTTSFARHRFKVVGKIGRSHTQKHTFLVSRVQWYPHDTGVFTSSGFDGLLKVWDTNELCVASKFKFLHKIYCHRMSKSLLLIAVGSANDKIQLVDLKSNSTTHQLTGHYKKAVVDICWSPKNDHHLVSAGKDGKVILWDVRKARNCCLMFDRHNDKSSASSASANSAHDGSVNSVCFLPDGNHLLSFATDDCVRLWNSTTGKNMLCNYGKIVNRSDLNVAAACTDSFAFVPSEKNVVVLDIHGGCPVKSLKGHLDRVNCCVYKSNLQELISGSNDRNILYWSSATEEAGGVEECDVATKVDPSSHSVGPSGRAGSQETPGNRVNLLTSDAWSDDET